MIIAVVGSGGKTTRIHNLAEEYIKQEKTVFVTTTTHMLKEEDTLITDSLDVIQRELETKGYCMAGTCTSDGKIGSLPEKLLKEVNQIADVVLIEADGSKGLPIKFPGENEPVIPEEIDEIHVVTGLSALDKMFGKVSHRLSLVKECLKISEETLVEPKHLQQLAMEGYVKPLRKKYPEVKVKICPGQVNTLYEKIVAEFLREEKDVSVIQKEWFQLQPQLIIFGGGHVSGKLLKLAKFLGFYTVVIDDREEFANILNLPEADEIYCCEFDQVENVLPYGDWNYYVVVTRGHAADRICVEKVLNRSYEYLGMIGSKKKVTTTFEALKKDGFSQEQIKTIHAPIGLKIGARTPEEIAVSIAAELIQCKNLGTISTMTKELLETDQNGLLCVITNKSGSSPRGVGSMMLVTSDGIIGSIGGGILEKTVIEEAKSKKTICKETYDLSNSENAKLGMICGGKNEILFIPIHE